MEKIGQHIEKLLAQHDYVIVPNLGGFVIQTQSAVFFSDHITPPLCTIGFNPLMLHSDGLLAIELAKSEKISYRAAMEFIDKEVENTKKRLKTTKSIQLGTLGVLTQSTDGNLLFSPMDKVDFLPMNFELSDIYIAERINQQDEERRKITFTLPTTRIYKYAATGILIFSLLLVSPHANDIRKTETANITSLAFVKTPEIAIKPSTSTKASITKVPDQTTTEETNNYHVIVASLPNQKSADKYYKALLEEKFSQAHILPSKKIYRIAIQSFSDRDKAIEFMENLRKSDSQFETAWVLCN